MDDRIVAVYASSKDYYIFAPVVVGSLLKNHPDAKVYFFADDDTVPGMEHPNVQILNVNKFPNMIPPTSPNITQRFSKMTLVKCWLPEWLPEEDKVIWFDMDTMVLDTIKPIWDLDITNTMIYGALDVLTLVERAAASGRTDIPIYVNMGVSILNLAFMRRMNMVSKFRKALSEEKFKYVDQDVMNDLCTPYIKLFSHVYNYGGTLPGYNTTEIVPHVRHFVAEGGWSKRFFLELFPLFNYVYPVSLKMLLDQPKEKEKE